MGAKTKQAIILIVVVFVVYAVVNDPNGSANVVNNAWDTIKDGLSGVGDFFDALLR